MPENPIFFKEKEFKYLQNTDFLITKKEVINKLRLLFKETELQINQVISPFKTVIPQEVLIKSGKLSKGENYRSLPYLILDYPRLFHPNNVFTFRTMFWWGNFFSCTIHIQGKILDKYRPVLLESKEDLFNKNIYIGISKSPWEYHYEDSNYKKIDELEENKIIQIVSEHPFLKLNKCINLADYEKLPHFASSTLLSFLKIIKIIS